MNDVITQCQENLDWYSSVLGKLRPDWMPPAEMYAYVLDMLERAEEKTGYPIDVARLNDHWIPLGIMGTMEWLTRSLWWFFEYTSFKRTNLQYEYYFLFEETYEFDPDRLIVFQEDPSNNALELRWNNPGLTDPEKVNVRNHNKWYYDKFDTECPDIFIVDYITWATFMWILEHGREWMDDMEELFRCATTFGKKHGQPFSYVSSWENQGKLLHPLHMIHTERELGSCANCGNSQWCVGWYKLGEHRGHFCNKCAFEMAPIHPPDEFDTRFEKDSCISCINTDCPYSDVIVDEENGKRIPRRLVDLGEDRVSEFRKLADKYGLPRINSGQTAEHISKYFIDG